MRSEPSTDITIDFYLNEETDSSGYGEAQYYLGNTELFTDSSGIADLDIHYLDSPPDANFWWADAVFPIPTNNASFVTATATDADGNTSEFCPNIHILPADIFVDIDSRLVLQDRGPSVEEDVTNPATTLWTVPKDGWERENSGALALLDEIPDAGILEWAGWSIVDRNWWIDVSDSSFESNFFPRQGREFFTGVNEAIAVADPDEWFDDYFSDNHADPLPEYLSTLKTPNHTINPNITGNQGFLIFNTSWRPSGNQTGVVLVSFDDAPPVELTRFDAASPFMANRAIKLPVTIPQDAQTARFHFRMEKARNDFWWALDSIEFYQLDSLVTSGGRKVFATDVSGRPGEVFSVPFTLQGYGDETALGFSIQFDHERFEFSGLDTAAGLSKVTNLSGVGTGRIGLILQQPTNGSFSSGESALASLDLKIKSNAPKGSYPLTFQNIPSYPEVVNASAEELTVNEWMGATLTVLNVPPQAVDDTFQIAENLNLTIPRSDLSANDIDPDDTTLTVTLSNAQTGETPTTGTVTTDAQGEFIYTPGPSFLDLAQGQTRNDVFYYQVTDASGDWDRGTVTVVVNGTEFEGDLSPAPNGNNLINSDDLTRIGRLVVGLDPSPTASQFQRADTAPRSLGGDGRLSVADYIQVGRYAAGLDNVPVEAHGPTQP